MANCRAVAAEAQSPSQDDDISSSSRLCAKSPEVPKVACVAGPSMDGSEQTSNSNDGTFRCAQQDSPSGHSSGYDFNNGFGPDFNFAENLNIESADNLGPSIGSGINLEVFLVHSPNVPEPPPKPIESYNLNPISSGLLALGQSVSPTPKSD
ncbi:hypothetical protein LOK49_LG05G02287 [Camellia lanceoleosa]|uniref:Uncharacterized protein n=1 Tax=Camellia lanceoleosa TaxID=1840588 RepID=A0ACC0HQR1_9ERIC|nr:hypothetical protein LOK49_LG05G02287 [Camellia lanceoleosa]